MNKSPAFQFYCQDFFVGTAHFTAEQVGGYIRLLIIQWDKGQLPNCDKTLLKLSGLKPKSLQKVKEKFILNEDGFLQNKRLEATRQEQAEYREKQRVKSEKRWTKTAEPTIPRDTSGISQTSTLQSSPSTSSSTSSTIHNTINTGAIAPPAVEENILTKTKTVYAPVDLPWPGPCFAAAWQAWKHYRLKEKRKGFSTADAELAQLKQLHQLSGGQQHTAITIIHQSMANTWAGLYPLKNITLPHAGTNQPHTAATKLPFWRKPIENGGAV